MLLLCPPDRLVCLKIQKDVESELADKVDSSAVRKARMSALQSQQYKQMKKYKTIADGSMLDTKPGGVQSPSNELMQLRKICHHPFLFESVMRSSSARLAR